MSFLFESVPNCKICKDQLIDNQACIRQCGHVFHYSCIKEWYENEPTCPTCQLILNVSDPRYDIIKIKGIQMQTAINSPCSQPKKLQSSESETNSIDDVYDKMDVLSKKSEQLGQQSIIQQNLIQSLRQENEKLKQQLDHIVKENIDLHKINQNITEQNQRLQQLKLNQNQNSNQNDEINPNHMQLNQIPRAMAQYFQIQGQDNKQQLIPQYLTYIQDNSSKNIFRIFVQNILERQLLNIQQVQEINKKLQNESIQIQRKNSQEQQHKESMQTFLYSQQGIQTSHMDILEVSSLYTEQFLKQNQSDINSSENKFQNEQQQQQIQNEDIQNNNYQYYQQQQSQHKNQMQDNEEDIFQQQY